MGDSISVKEYQDLIDSLRDGIIILQGEEILVFNSSLSEILELPADEISLDNILQRLSNTENATAKGCVHRIISGLVFGPIEFEVLLPGNRKRSLKVSTREARFSAMNAIQVTISDLTREFAVETELFDTLSLLHSIFDAIDEAILILDDPELTLRSSNTATERTLKIDRAAYKGKTLWNLLADSADAGIIIDDVRNKLPKLGSLHYNFEMRRGDGVTFPALHYITEVKDSSGAKIGLMWIISDMSQRVYLNRALAEVESRYRILFDRAADPTFIIDMETFQIIDANRASEKQLGYKRTELIGKTMMDLTPADRHQDLKNDIKRLSTTRSSTIRGINLTKAGKEIPVQTSMVITTFGGRDVIVAACRDVSQQLIMETKKLRIEKLEAVRQVAGGIAHEFSQPLQGLVTISEIIGKESIPHDQERDLISKIPPLVERMSLLLNQMKGITRLAIKPYVSRDNIVDIERSTQVIQMLIVEPDSEVREMAMRVAIARGIDAFTADNLEQARSQLESSQFDLLMIGKLQPKLETDGFLDKLSLTLPQVKVIQIERKGSPSARVRESDLIHSIDDALKGSGRV